MGRQLARQATGAGEEATLPAGMQGAGQLSQMLRPQSHVDERKALEQALAFDLRQAAGDDDHAPRVERLDAGGLAQVAGETVVGARPHGAGVVDDDVGAVDAGHALEALGLEQRTDALGVVVVHLAAERPQIERAHGRPVPARPTSRARWRGSRG